MPDFHLETSDGIAMLIWDQPGRSINVMTLQGLDELQAALGSALVDPQVRGIVITSAKPDFAAGMDLNVIAGLKAASGTNPEQGLMQGFRRMHALFRQIELAQKPVIAALPGTALGIGLELALACHHIVAADNAIAKIGLPELGLGIFPGAGGSTRLVRLLGLKDAAAWLLDARLTDPVGALAAGLVQQMVPLAELLPTARALAGAGMGLPKPWDRGEPTPGGATNPGFDVLAEGAALRPMGKAPATAALIAVMRAAARSFAEGIEAETRELARVLLHPAAEASLRTAFISKSQLEKGARRPALPDQSVQRLGVLGAGMMGAGIAHVAALAGVDVVLLDATQSAADRGKAHSAKLLDAAVGKGRMPPARRDAILGRIAAVTEYGALAACDLIIEAVFEDPAVKAEVTRKAEAATPATAIFASNTSTLPIAGLARASVRPEQFVGIHFFSPVDRMALVEIIRGPLTSDRAVAKALDFARQIRKTPIVVNDARYFFANRCIVPYLNECLRLVGEGVAAALVEESCRRLGMPVGGLQLLDETSIDLGVKIAEASKAALGAAYTHDAADAVLIRLLAEGRLGRKNSKGFYDYGTDGRRAGLWDGLAVLWRQLCPQPTTQEVQDRLLLVQVIEAVRAFEEGVLSDVREGDVAAVLGWGFAPWSGGPFGWVDAVGAGQVASLCNDLAARHGPRFVAPALLRSMAEEGGRFYPA
ncbi:MAG: enoyl-CoA hydratase/isomerase family protein [Burkholderiaceae bacterium]|nr:enoyl-CoA hydratase/isomerase family protein [Burkholderiaceae bacterium]